MKFKGFWKGLWELNKESLRWLRDYWLAYTILLVIVTLIAYGPYLYSAYKGLKLANESDDELDDFLN